jgi:hypothetical protein
MRLTSSQWALDRGIGDREPNLLECFPPSQNGLIYAVDQSAIEVKQNCRSARLRFSLFFQSRLLLEVSAVGAWDDEFRSPARPIR